MPSGKNGRPSRIVRPSESILTRRGVGLATRAKGAAAEPIFLPFRHSEHETSFVPQAKSEVSRVAAASDADKTSPATVTGRAAFDLSPSPIYVNVAEYSSNLFVCKSTLIEAENRTAPPADSLRYAFENTPSTGGMSNSSTLTLSITARPEMHPCAIGMTYAWATLSGMTLLTVSSRRQSSVVPFSIGLAIDENTHLPLASKQSRHIEIPCAEVFRSVTTFSVRTSADSR